jgi:Fe2+ transport system protein B
MSCTTKLTVYGYFTAIFFPKTGGFVFIALYVLGILVGLLVALVAHKTVDRAEAVPFVMELPNYRLPSVKSVLMLVWEKTKDFLGRAFTVVFVAAVVVWFLQSFSPTFELVSDSHDSILAVLATGLAPVFAPLGFGDWRIATSLIAGFMAKEIVASTLTVLFGSTAEVLAVLTPLSAVTLMVFCLLYTPCVAAVAAIRRELREELGADVDVVAKIGVVSDFYNLIRRHNVNNYYLCRVRSFGDRHLTPDEVDCFHLSTLKLRFDDAAREYERCADSRIGRLIAARELPVLRRAKELLSARGIVLEERE